MVDAVVERSDLSRGTSIRDALAMLARWQRSVMLMLDGVTVFSTSSQLFNQLLLRTLIPKRQIAAFKTLWSFFATLVRLTQVVLHNILSSCVVFLLINISRLDAVQKIVIDFLPRST